MTGLYSINGVDISTYGIIAVDSFINELLTFPESKEVYSRSWDDEDGTEYYLDVRAWKDKTATLKGALEAENKQDFLAKRAALWTVLSATGEMVIYSHALNLSFRAFYKRNPLVNLLTTTAGEITMKLDLEFQILGISDPSGALLTIDNVPLLMDGVQLYMK